MFIAQWRIRNKGAKEEVNTILVTFKPQVNID